jgi:hypothetical protein
MWRCWVVVHHEFGSGWCQANGRARLSAGVATIDRSGSRLGLETTAQAPQTSYAEMSDRVKCDASS